MHLRKAAKMPAICVMSACDGFISNLHHKQNIPRKEGIKLKEHIQVVIYFDDLSILSNAAHFLLLYSSGINK
jgi:hypothetical protein